MGTIYASVANGNIALAPANNQTEATAEITKRTAVGEPTIALWTGSRYSAQSLPPGAVYANYVYSGGSFVLASTLPTLDNLKEAFRQNHEFLNGLSARLEGREAQFWRHNIIGKAHDIIAGIHKANRAIGKQEAGAAGLTIAQRMQYCALMPLGTSDLASIAITDIDARIHKIYEIISQSSFTVPDRPLCYIDPRNTPTAVSLHDMANLTGTGNYTPHGGGAQVAGLGFDTLTDFSGVDLSGSWIDTIAA